MKEPISFLDPLNYPVSFTGKRTGSFDFFQDSFPVSFKFDPHPRSADILAIAADFNGTIKIDKDISDSQTVSLFSENTSHRIELYAEGENLETSTFYLKICSGEIPLICRPMQVSHIRQTSSTVDISHIFSMEPSTYLFSEIYGLYPSAYLKLSFLPTLRNCDCLWADINLPDKTETSVLLKPNGAYGILDIIAELKLKWYVNEERTVIYNGTGPIERKDRFGIRFYISDFGVFSNKIQILDSGAAIVDGMLPQQSLERLGYPAADIIYFGGGTRNCDLFFGKEKSVVIDNSGLPIQNSSATPVYILPNMLDDIESSSINSSSSSSRSSKSTNSSESSISRLSSQSSSTVASFTSSISSASSVSSISSKSSSISSGTFPSSESSLTETFTSISTKFMTSSISSISSSTVRESRLVAKYLFDETHDAFGYVFDYSGNELNAKIPVAGGGIYPPKWSSTYGRGSGGYRFYGNDSQSQYLYRSDVSRFILEDTGTMSIWINPLGAGNQHQCILSISNGFVSEKTEFIIEADYSSLSYSASLMIGGIIKWKIKTQNETLEINKWVHISIVHNGSSPKIYLNGIEAECDFETSTSPEKWLDALSPGFPQNLQLYVGATPRNKVPYMSLGLFALIDEIVIWDGALDSNQVFDAFSEKLSSSS